MSLRLAGNLAALRRSRIEALLGTYSVVVAPSAVPPHSARGRLHPWGAHDMGGLAIVIWRVEYATFVFGRWEYERSQSQSQEPDTH